jgi:hypothetical protein
MRGLRTLRGWDARRAAAYAAADPRRLRGLYTPGSEAGRHDVALLRRYAERRLVVHGVVPQIREVAVIEHRPGLLRVAVQERYPRLVVQGTAAAGREAAVEHVGQWRYRSRAVELRRSAHGWRVASVERA